MSHKATIIHSEINNDFVMKIVEFEDQFQIITNCNGHEEIVFINRKNGKITHTTEEK